MNIFRLLFVGVEFCRLEIIPAIIGAAALLGGAALSAKGSRDASEDARAHSEWQQAMNERLQREFAQHGVRWRVEDAKAAGLHPLYALGANTPTFSPTVTAFQPENALASMGQAVGRIGEYVADSPNRAADKRIQNAQVRLIEAQANKEEIAAMALASEIGQRAQAATSWQAFPAATDALLGVDRFAGDYSDRVSRLFGSASGGVIPGQGAVNMQASKSVSAFPGEPYREAASDVPLTKEFKTKWGNILLPGTEATEALESMEPWGVALIIAENMAHYGEKGVRRLLKYAVDKGWSGWAGIIGRYMKEKGL